MLLIVFGTMLAMSSLHVHSEYENYAADCTECEHNVHHSGHLASAVFSLDDCVLCQFAALQFLPVVISAVILFINLFYVGTFAGRQTVASASVDSNALRGPPFLVCF